MAHRDVVAHLVTVERIENEIVGQISVDELLGRDRVEDDEGEERKDEAAEATRSASRRDALAGAPHRSKPPR